MPKANDEMKKLYVSDNIMSWDPQGTNKDKYLDFAKLLSSILELSVCVEIKH